MTFEWDEAKNRANVGNHGIDFADVCRIFDGPLVTEPDLRFEYGEIRFVSYGCLDEILIVAVVHTKRGAITRIISARPAKLRERVKYETSLRSRTNN